MNRRRGNDAHDKMKMPCIRPNFGLMLLVMVFIMIQKVQAADVLEDLVKSLASDGASCLVMVADKWTSSDYLNDDNHIPMTFIDSSINSSTVGSVLPPMQGIHPVSDCSHYLLWFKDANGTLIFLDRCDNSTFKVKFQMNHNQIVSDTSNNWGFLQGVNSSPI